MNTRITCHPPKRGEDGRYYVTVSYYLGGKRLQKRKTGFERSKDAKNAGMEMKKRLEESLPAMLLTGVESPTLEEFVLQYNRIVGERWSDGTKRVRASSIKRCDFLAKKLTDITRMDIELNIARLKGRYKYNTLNSHLSGWMVYINAAKDYGYIGTAPRVKLDRPKEEKKVKALSMERAWKLHDDLQDPEARLITIIGLTTGLRIGEISDLKESDFDFDRGVLTVSHQWLDNPTPGRRNAPLKTNNSYRTVPLSQRTLRAVKEYPVRTVGGYLFPRPRGLGKRLWWRYHQAGVDASPHTLRHTYVTELIRSKQFDLQSVAALAGDTIATILKTYSHYLEEAAEENKEKIKALFG